MSELQPGTGNHVTGGIWSKTFWKATVERAIKTFLQSAIASGVVSIATFNDLKVVLISSLIATGLSVVMSILSAIPDGNPSVGGQEITRGNVKELISEQTGIAPNETLPDGKDAV